MRLGDIARIYVYSANPQASLPFYEGLGFKRIEEEGPEISLSDGKLMITPKEGSESKSELAYFSGDINEKVAVLERAGIACRYDQENEARFTSPDGLAIRLISRDTSKMHRPEGMPLSRCGRFFEASIETSSVDSSIDFWNRLGFTVQFRDPPTARWATLTDDIIKLGVYEYGTCPHKFKNPSLTYFEPDMSRRIEELKSDGVVFAQEMPNKEGKIIDAVLESPDGQYFFLFFYDGEYPD